MDNECVLFWASEAEKWIQFTIWFYGFFFAIWFYVFLFFFFGFVFFLFTIIDHASTVWSKIYFASMQICLTSTNKTSNLIKWPYTIFMSD